MSTEIVMALVGVVCTGLSSFVTFLLTRKKYNSEVEAQHIENVKEAFETYKSTVKDTFEEQNRKIESLQKENDDLRRQISMLQSQLVNALMGKSLNAIQMLAQGNVEGHE